MGLVHASQEVQHGGANVGAPLSDHIGINRGADVVTEGYESGLLEMRDDLAHDLIRSALVTRKHQEARRQGAKCVGVHTPWANQGQRCDVVGISGRKSPPVSYSTGREVGLLDTQVLENLQETFLYRQFYFCRHNSPLSPKTQYGLARRD